MNPLIEERILSMKFNNEQFERNIRRSTESIERLNQAVNRSTADINRSMSRLDFGNSSMRNIERSLDLISSRFTTLGIVGMNVINRLTNAAINMGKQIYNSTIGQIKSGGMKRALNIEQASFLLEGLGLDVAQIKEDAMYAVEGTAYGFDEAAKAAASFGASGVQAGEDMKEALLGVSGVAAMTGRDYQSIADIFTTIASNGKLMTMQLRQFSASGLNVSAALAKYLGKTEQEINEMVTKGQISFETFAKAMNETFGQHAKDANKTFTGSMSNMKAALSRVGEAFATPYIENMIPVFNKLKDVINDVKKALGPLIDDTSSLMKVLSDFAVGALDKLQNSGAIVDIMYGLRHIFLGIVGVIGALSKAIKETFPNVGSLSQLFRNLTLYLVPTRESFEKLVNVFKAIIEVVKMVAKVVAGVLNFIVKAVPTVVNAIKTAVIIIYAIILKIYETLSQSVFFQSLFNGIKKILDGIKLAFFVIIALIIKLKEGIDAILADERVQAFLLGLKTVATNVFNTLADLIKNMDAKWGAFAGTLVAVAFGIIMFKTVMRAAFKPLEIFVGFAKSFLGVFQSINNFFNSGAGMFQGIKNFFDAMQKAQRMSIASDVVLKLAASIAILAVSLKLLATIQWNELLVGMGVILLLMVTLTLSMKVLNEVGEQSKTARGILSFAIAMGILTLAIKSIGSMSWDELAVAAGGMALLAVVVAGFMALSNVFSGIDTAGFIFFALCVNLLTLPLMLLGLMSWDQLAVAAAGMGFLVVIVGLFELLSKVFTGIDTAGFLIFGVCINLLTIAFVNLSKVPLEQITNAIVSLGAIAAFVVSIMLLSNLTRRVGIKQLLKIVTIAKILTTVVNSLTGFTALPMEQIKVAAIGLGAVMVALAAAILILSKVRSQSFDLNMISNVLAASIMLIAVSESLKVVADIPTDNLIAAATAISAMFLALSVGIRLMSGSTGAVALLAASVGLMAIAGALKIVASIPTENLMPAALALAAIMGALVIFGAVVGALPIIGAALLALTTAMLGFSVAAIAFGAAMLLISTAFATFVNALVSLSTVSETEVARINSNLLLFVAGLGDAALAFANQGPKFAAALSMVFEAIITAIGNIRVKIADTIVNTFVLVVQKITEAFPLLLEAFGEMLIDISNWFKEHENEIEEIGYNIGKGLLKGIIAGMEGLSDAVYEYIDDTFVHSAASDSAMEAAAQQQAQTYANAFEKWFNYYDAGTYSADQLIAGLKNGLATGAFEAEDVMRELAARGLEGYEDELGIHSPSLEMIENGEYTIAGVIEGIKNGEYTFEQVMAALGKNGANAFMSQFSGIEGLMSTLNGAGIQAAGTDWRAIGSSYEDERGYTKSMQRWQQEGFGSLDEFVEHHQTAEMEEIMGEWGYHAEETADAEEDLTEQTEELNKSLAGTGGLSDSASKATKETDKLKDSIKSALDIFSGFDVQLDMTSKDVLKSFSDQLIGVQAWSKELEALAGRGIAKELLNELAEAGPSAINRIHALYSMTEDQLSLFNKMYEQKLSLEKTTADEIRASFGQVGDKSGEEVGQAIGDGIAEGTKEGVEQATTYVEQFVDDGQKAGDIIRYDDRGFALTKALPRFRYEGYETATAWEEAHRKACTKMVPVIANTYSKVGEAASESVKETVEGTTDTVINEMEQGVIDAHKIGAEYEYINGVIIPNTIKDSIKEATPGIAAIFGEMGYQSMEAFEHMLNVEDAISMVEMFQAGLEDSITSSLKLFDEVKEKEDISAEEMLKRMKENVKNIGKWANDLQTLASRGISEGLLNELQALGPEGADKVHAFTKMTDAQLQQANNAFAASAALPKQVSDRITKSYAEAGMNTTLGFVEGIDPTAAEEVMTALGTYSLAALKEALDIHSPSGKMMEAGMYTVAGLVQGITDGLAQITEVGAEMGSALISSVLAAPEVISEKVTEFFTHLGDIFIGGIKKFGESEAMITFRDTVVDMLNMSLDDILIEPTIRPVIDFESMGDSLGVINGMFNRGFNISPAVGKADNAFGANKTDYTGYLKDMTNLLKQTNEEVAGIRTDVNRLDRDMAELTVNLDGYSVGKLVSPYVNRNLGQTYVNNKRRTM